MEVYKERSYVACIKDGFGFFIKNLKPLCYAMLPYCIVFSILSLFINLYITNQYVSILTNGDIQPSRILYGYGLLFLLLIVELLCFLYADGRLMLYNRQMMGLEQEDTLSGKGKRWVNTIKRTTHMVIRILPFTAVGMAILFVFMLIIAAFASLVSACGIKDILFLCLIPVLLLTIIALLVLFQPLIYSGYEFLIEDKKISLSAMWKSYKTGSKYILKYMGVTLLTSFITSVITLLLRLPEFIFSQSYMESLKESILTNGDTQISTFNISLLLLFSALASALVFLINCTPLNFVQLYLYGNVKAKEGLQVEHKS